MKELLGSLSGILFVLAFVPYILGICKKAKPFGWRIWNKLDAYPSIEKVEPVKVTWISWLAVDLVIFSAMVAQGTVNWQIIGAIVGAGIVVALALVYGKSGWDWMDKFFLTGAAIGIVMWQVYDSSLLGLVICLTVLFCCGIKTFLQAWNEPHKESKVAWTLWWLSCVCAVAAIPQWTWADSLQPLTFFLIESIVCSIIYLRPQPKARS